eukprot:7650589-Pyramimonas_sp.AAC.1
MTDVGGSGVRRSPLLEVDAVGPRHRLSFAFGTGRETTEREGPRSRASYAHDRCRTILYAEPGRAEPRRPGDSAAAAVLYSETWHAMPISST